MNRKQLTLLITSALAVSVWGIAAAESYNLNPVIVTAQRVQVNEQNTPATVTVIQGEEIERTGAASTFDALARTVGMSSYAYADGYGSTGSSVGRVYLRGLDKGTLILVNGTPLNQMNYGSPEAIPENAIERIEIVKGSASVLYGAEAMGGVVNIITKRPEGGSKPIYTLAASLGNVEKNISLSAQNDRFLISYQNKWIKDYPDAQLPYLHKKNKATGNVEYPFAAGLQKRTMENIFLSYRISDEWTIDWARHLSKSGVLHRSLKEPGVWSNERKIAGYDYKETRDNIGLHYENQDGWRANLAYNTKQTLGWRLTPELNRVNMGSSSNYRVNNYYFDAQKETQLENGRWILGAMAYREEYKEIHQGTGKHIGRNQLAIFGSYEWHPSEKWTWILGAREHFSLDNNWDKSQHVFLPQVQGLYALTPELNWYVNVGKSFEMPAINNKFARSNAVPSAISPQSGWTYETGLKWNKGDHSLKLAAFYMDVDNMFGWERIKNVVPDYVAKGLDGESQIQINRGHFKNKGVELEYRQNVNKYFSWYAGATFQDPKVQEKENSPWTQLEAKMQGQIGWYYQKDRWSAGMDGFLEARRQDNNRKADYGTSHLPSRFSLNATVGYQLSDTTQMNLTIRNILDKENYTQTYMWKERPRNFLLTIRHQF